MTLELLTWETTHEPRAPRGWPPQGLTIADFSQ